MNYKVITTKKFEKKLKRLAKKYHSIRNDYIEFLSEIKENPFSGADLGNGLHKVRMRISDKGKGKSGGARIITHTALINIDEGEIALLTIYDKSEQESISNKELAELLNDINQLLN